MKMLAAFPAILLALCATVSAEPLLWTEDSLGNIVTDFGPGETAYINGNGFTANTLVHVTVIDPLGGTEELLATSLDDGTFVVGYFVPGIIGEYLVTATDSFFTAQMIFTDAAIWTTDGTCGGDAQDTNHFSVGDHVYINGDGFDEGTYSWEIRGKPGGSSCDSNTVVASGSYAVNASGYFCFAAYTVLSGDCGEYGVEFGNKKDNYRVSSVACSSLTSETDCLNEGCYWCDECNGYYISTYGAGMCMDSSADCTYNGCDFTCGAICEADSDCPGDSCSLTLQDYCVGKELAEYNSNSIFDSITITATCSGICNGDCTCLSCDAVCMPPEILTHCVIGVCDANCEYDSDCTDGTCHETFYDYCIGKTLAEYDSDMALDYTDVYGSCDNTCNGCECTDCHASCEAPTLNTYCSIGVCGADCSSDSDCPDSHCEETYIDYCNGNILVEYNSNRILDSTTVTNSQANTCNECECTSNPVTCSQPATSTYCVIGVCGANCEYDSDCDDEDPFTYDSCSSCLCSHVQLGYCGDGAVNNDGEECDDGNENNLDSCRNDCTLPYCGDSILDSGEECDDGNENNLDSCRNDCTLPYCGDNIVDDDEECDDGGQVDGDGCSSVCVQEYCGDGIVQTGLSEECDDANDINLDACRNDCKKPYCGDGIVDEGEQCDDANQDSSDGCSSSCMVECPPTGAPDVIDGITENYVRKFDLCLMADGQNRGNGKIYPRSSLYAYTGEQLEFLLVVRDTDGALDIGHVKALVNGAEEVLANPADLPKTCNGFGKLNPETDKAFHIMITVETQWYGDSVVSFVYYNSSGMPTRILHTENWFFNPALSLDVSTSDGMPIHFEQGLPGEWVHSLNKIKVKNVGEGGVNLWMYIAGTDLYDPNGASKCPTTNKISLENMLFRAWSGTQWQTSEGWKAMKNYNQNDGCSLYGTCYGAVPLPDIPPVCNMLTNRGTMEIEFKLKYPVPCIGEFSQGKIYIFGKVV